MCCSAVVVGHCLVQLPALLVIPNLQNFNGMLQKLERPVGPIGPAYRVRRVVREDRENGWTGDVLARSTGGVLCHHFVGQYAFSRVISSISCNVRYDFTAVRLALHAVVTVVLQIEVVKFEGVDDVFVGIFVHTRLDTCLSAMYVQISSADGAALNTKPAGGRVVSIHAFAAKPVHHVAAVNLVRNNRFFSLPQPPRLRLFFQSKQVLVPLFPIFCIIILVGPVLQAVLANSTCCRLLHFHDVFVW